MTTILRRGGGRIAIVVAALVCLALLSWFRNEPAQAIPAEGLACETSASNSFSLTATSGYILTPDGNSIYMWGYAGPSGTFQLPGPTLCVPEGAKVTVALKNLLREPVSISFPGQTGVKADGKPDQPTFSGGTLTSLAKPAATNATVTYTFTANRAGTFLYRSGTDVAKQVQMGLYGALVVRPSDGSGGMVQGRAYDDPSSVFDSQHEYIHLLSEIDPAFHQAVERKRAIDLNSFNSRYFLINGRSMPDTIAPNNVAWLPTQPYGAMVHIKPYDQNTNPKPALIRYLNAGFGTYPFHPHGNDQTVIGRDGNALITSDPSSDASYEKYLVDIGPGQTVDTTLKWTDAEGWDPTANPIPVDLPPLQDQLVSPDTWFSESPYLGHTGDLPAGVTSNNQCGEYYHVAHSHALQQATNYGATFGGMMTLIRIDPPAGCPGATS
jgi:FtsP/CotA-like multicopper oxidase with cupredoxin domain